MSNLKMKDYPGQPPSLKIGDIVKSKETGCLGVIRIAKVEVPLDEFEKYPQMPQYAIDILPGQIVSGKCAWYELDELEIIELGILHKPEYANVS
jgi:hypothetical protein